MDERNAADRAAAGPAVVDPRRLGQVVPLDVPLALGMILALVAALIVLFG